MKYRMRAVVLCAVGAALMAAPDEVGAQRPVGPGAANAVRDPNVAGTPSASELIEAFGATQKAIREKSTSYILVAEISCLDDMMMLARLRVPNPRVPTEIQEYRTDGERFAVHEKSLTVLQEPEWNLPGDRRSRTWLWDGRYYYFWGGGSEQFMEAWLERYPPEPERLDLMMRRLRGAIDVHTNPQDKKIAGLIRERRPNLGDLGEYEWLHSAERVTVGRAETINGSTCWPIDVKSKRGLSRLWLDPSHGYHIAQRDDRFPDGGRNRMVWDVVFGQVEGLWFPMENKFRYFNSEGRYSEDRNLYKVVKLAVEPDHEKLRSFVPTPHREAPVRILEKEGIDAKQTFTWDEGLVKDIDGKVVLDCRPSAAETKGG